MIYALAVFVDFKGGIQHSTEKTVQRKAMLGRDQRKDARTMVVPILKPKFCATRVNASKYIQTSTFHYCLLPKHSKIANICSARIHLKHDQYNFVTFVTYSVGVLI